MEYIIFAVIVYALFLLENKKSSTMKDVKNLKYGKRQSRISIVAIVLMILFAGLRNYTIGYDLPNYKKNFDLIYNNNDLKGHSFEKCFQVLNYCCSKIFGNIYGFNAMLLVSHDRSLCGSICCNKYFFRYFIDNVFVYCDRSFF